MPTWYPINSPNHLRYLNDYLEALMADVAKNFAAYINLYCPGRNITNMRAN